MAVTTTANVDPEVDLYFDNILLDREQPDFVFGLFGQQRRIPQKNSKTLVAHDDVKICGSITPHE